MPGSPAEDLDFAEEVSEIMRSFLGFRMRFAVSVGICVTFVIGCGNQNTYRDDAAKQNAIEAQVRDQQLTPVVGTYCGKMHLIKSGLDFDVSIILALGEINIHSPQTSDPTLTSRVPKLVGSMRFPAVDAAGSAAYASLPDLIQAMGGYGALSITEGDYTPANRQVYLPFMVPGHTQGNYGEVRGLFEKGRFAGTWFSNSYQTIGNFDVSFCN